MTLRMPGPTNVFIPSPEATGQIIGFSRDPKKFLLPMYAQYVPVKEIVGLYTYLDPRQSVRVPSDAAVNWGRGSVRPMHENNLTPFEYLEYRCQRRDYGFVLPDEVNINPSWKVRATHASMTLSQAMTNRTNLLKTLLTTAGNWAGQTDTATNLNGGAGFWDTASNDPTDPGYLAIKKTFDAVILGIKRRTNSNVGAKDLRAVMGPAIAQKISQTDEIRDFLKQSRFAMDQVRGTNPGRNAEYNLPDQIYGVELVVEDATIDTNLVAAPGTAADTADIQDFVYQESDGVVFMSQKGGIDGEAGAPTFSTVQFYFYEELSVETLDDRRNRREEGHVVDDFDIKMTAPAAGYWVQEVITP